MLQLLLHLHFLRSQIAYFPPNCLAGGSASATELTVCVGGCLGHCHRRAICQLQEASLKLQVLDQLAAMAAAAVDCHLHFETQGVPS